MKETKIFLGSIEKVKDFVGIFSIFADGRKKIGRKRNAPPDFFVLRLPRQLQGFIYLLKYSKPSFPTYFLIRSASCKNSFLFAALP